MRTLAIAGLMLGVGVSSAWADTVWMKNGDRLTGKVILLDGGRLVFNTEYGGDVTIKWADVKTLESDRPMVVKKVDSHTDTATTYSIAPAGEGEVTLASGTQAEVIPLKNVAQLLAPKPIIRDFNWTGHVGVALDFKRANNKTEDYNLDFDSKARHGMWRHNIYGSYEQQYSNKKKVTDQWNAEYALDRFLTEQWFWQGRLELKHDQIQDVRRQRIVGTGPGYQFWDNELGAFSLAGLINNTSYRLADGQTRRFGSATGKWSYNRFLLGKNIELFSNGELGKPFSSIADYTLDAELGLRYRLTDWASLNIKAQRDVVKGNRDADQHETRYTMGVGASW